MISRSEASYIATGLDPGPGDEAPAIRPDGRAAFSFRPINLALGVAPQANGSARCGLGGTDVLVGCKLEVAATDEARRIACSVDLSALSFSPRLSKLMSSEISSPAASSGLPSDLAQDLADFLSSLFAPLASSPQLSISPLQHWILYIDAVVLSSSGGNLYDVLAMTARMAVGDVLVPRTKPAIYKAPEAESTVQAVEEAGIKGLLRGDQDRRSEGTKTVDFELLDREAGQGMTWQDREKIPVVVTLNLLDRRPFLDATLAEEQVATSRLVLGFSNGGKQLCHVHHTGAAEIESDRVFRLIRQAAPVAADLQKSLDGRWTDSKSSAGGVMLSATF